MATIQVTSDSPFALTITLTDRERKAVIAAAQEAARLSPQAETPRDHLVSQLRGFFAAFVRRDDERESNTFLQRLSAATPEQRAAALAALPSL